MLEPVLLATIVLGFTVFWLKLFFFPLAITYAFAKRSFGKRFLRSSPTLRHARIWGLLRHHVFPTSFVHVYARHSTEVSVGPTAIESSPPPTNPFVRSRFVTAEALFECAGLKGRAVICACYPHEVIPLAPVLNFCCSPTTEWTVYVHDILIKTPVLGDLMLLFGGASANREAIREHLKTPDARAAIIPDGARGMWERFDTSHTLQTRTGVAELAFDTKACVAICYTPAEEHTFFSYYPVNGWLYEVRKWCHARFGFPFPVFCFGPIPQARFTTFVRLHDPLLYSSRDAYLADYLNKISHLRQYVDREGIW